MSEEEHKDILPSDSEKPPADIFENMKDPNRPTRRAPEMERYVKVKKYLSPFVDKERPHTFSVWVEVGVQSFAVLQNEEDETRAIWFGDMVAIALKNLVELERSRAKIKEGLEEAIDLAKRGLPTQ